MGGVHCIPWVLPNLLCFVAEIRDRSCTGRHEFPPPIGRKKMNDGGFSRRLFISFVIINEFRIQHPTAHVCQTLDS